MEENYTVAELVNIVSCVQIFFFVCVCQLFFWHSPCLGPDAFSTAGFYFSCVCVCVLPHGPLINWICWYVIV